MMKKMLPLNQLTKLFINTSNKNGFSVKGTPSETELILKSKTPQLGEVKITFDDIDLDNEIYPEIELKIEVKGTVLPIKDIPPNTWETLLPLLNFKPKPITLDAVSQHFFGRPLSKLEADAKENYKRLTEEANKIAKRIDPQSKSWQETMKTLRKQRSGSSSEVLSQYEKAVPEAVSYMEKKGWVKGNNKPIEVVEDSNPENGVASVSERDGNVYIGTKIPEAEVYYPFMTKAIALHESVHSLDNQEKGMASSVIREGIAYLLEKKAYEAGDYYTSDAERLGAIQLQLLRNALVIKHVEEERGTITRKQTNEFLATELLWSTRESKKRKIREDSLFAPSKTELSLKRLGYVGGSEAIEALWKAVKKKHPETSFKDFVSKLLKNGSRDIDIPIATISKKEFGIDFKRSN